VALLTVAGGAVLERYLLPAMPILYAAMAAAFSLYSQRAKIVSAAALVCGLGASNFINPPYPFPYENNLAFADFLKVQAEAADYLQHQHPSANVHTAWPLTAELSNPQLGFVSRGLGVRNLPNLSTQTLDSIDWSEVQVLVAFSRTWNPRISAMHFGPLAKLWRDCYGYVANATRKEARAHVPLPLEAHFERRGQWVDVYVNLQKAPSLAHAIR
jgi:hypothetical protein